MGYCPLNHFLKNLNTIPLHFYQGILDIEWCWDFKTLLYAFL